MEIDYLLHIHRARGPYLENIVRGPSGTDPAKRGPYKKYCGRYSSSTVPN